LKNPFPSAKSDEDTKIRKHFIFFFSFVHLPGQTYKNDHRANFSYLRDKNDDRLFFRCKRSPGRGRAVKFYSGLCQFPPLSSGGIKMMI
jgi:hypothetical protein